MVVKKAFSPNHLSPRFLGEGVQSLSDRFVKDISHHRGKTATLPLSTKKMTNFTVKLSAISLLDLVGKMERCVHKHLYNFICEIQMLTPFQPGFVLGDSTSYQLLHT